MQSFKSFIYEASLLGRTTKYSGSLGAFKQYVELSPNNKIFELEKDAELYQMDGSPMDETLKKGTKLEIMDREEKHVKTVERSLAIRVNITDSKYRRYKGQDFLIKLNKILKPSGKNVEPMEVDLNDKINPDVFTNFKAGHGHEGQFTEAWIKGSGDNWQFDYKGKEYKVVELRAPDWRGQGNPKTDVTVVLDKKIPTFPSRYMKYSLKAENATYFENWMLPERFLQIYDKAYGSKLLNLALEEINEKGSIGGTKTNTHSICPFIAKKWNFAPKLNPAQMREVISGSVKFDDGEGAANVFYGGNIPTKPDMIQQIIKGTKTAGEMSKKITAGLSLRGSSDIKNSSCFIKGEDGKWYINDMKRNGWGDLFDIKKEFYRS